MKMKKLKEMFKSKVKETEEKEEKNPNWTNPFEENLPQNPLDVESPLDKKVGGDSDVKVERESSYYRKIIADYKKLIESHKKLLLKWKTRCKTQKESYESYIKELKKLREEETKEYEFEIGKLNNLIGIMKTGRIKYVREIKIPNEYIPSENMTNHPSYPERTQLVSGMLFLQEIQQVEVREDYVLVVTNSGREIALDKEYDYLENLFSIK
jgi:hypothetical protein